MGTLTVRDLKEVLEGLDDDTPIFTSSQDSKECGSITKVEIGGIKPSKTVYLTTDLFVE